MSTKTLSLLLNPRRHCLVFIAPLAFGCAQLSQPQGCPQGEPAPQVVAGTQPDEETCLQFSIDATQEPGTLNAPTVRAGFPLDPGRRYRLTALTTSVPWKDGQAPATPATGWTGWRAIVGYPAKYNAICPRANMYQAVCAPSGSPNHCHAADGKVFQPDEIGSPNCFANDWAGDYGNNSGCVAVRLCRLSLVPAAPDGKSTSIQK